MIAPDLPNCHGKFVEAWYPLSKRRQDKASLSLQYTGGSKYLLRTHIQRQAGCS